MYVFKGCQFTLLTSLLELNNLLFVLPSFDNYQQILLTFLYHSLRYSSTVLCYSVNCNTVVS